MLLNIHKNFMIKRLKLKLNKVKDKRYTKKLQAPNL